MRFYITDVASIIPPKNYPKTIEEQQTIKALALSIIECNGLITPIILKRTSKYAQEFIIVSNEIAYHAAKLAQELKPQQCEMVNAFIIDTKEKANIIKQLNI